MTAPTGSDNERRAQMAAIVAAERERRRQAAPDELRQPMTAVERADLIRRADEALGAGKVADSIALRTAAMPASYGGTGELLPEQQEA